MKISLKQYWKFQSFSLAAFLFSLIMSIYSDITIVKIINAMCAGFTLNGIIDFYMTFKCNGKLDRELKDYEESLNKINQAAFDHWTKQRDKDHLTFSDGIAQTRMPH